MVKLKGGEMPSRPTPAKPAAQEAEDHPKAPAQPIYEVDEAAHAELVELYKDSVENMRFAKSQQWRTLIYFTALIAAAVSVGVFLRWGDKTLVGFLFYSVWFFSIASVIVLAVLQSWQGSEQRKISFITSHFSEVARAALRRKSSMVGDIHRYIILVLMIVYVELATIAVAKMMWERF